MLRLGRQPVGALPQRQRVVHRGHRPLHRPPRPERPEVGAAVVAHRPHRGQPGERLRGELEPQAALREAGAPVVRRLVLGDHPQLADLGLQRVRADDRVDPVGQRDHLRHPGALLAGHEVVPDPGADVLAGARRRAGGRRRPGRRTPPGRAGRCSARCRLRRCASLTCAVNERSSSRECTPSGPSRSISPCSTSTVARASASARWIGAVAALKCAARVASLQSGTSSLVSTRRASRAVSTTRVRRPVPAGPGAGGLEEADVERRVVRDQHGVAGELEEGRQHLVDPRRGGHHRVGDAGEHRDQRRDAPAGVDQRGELAEHLAAAHLDRADLGDRPESSTRPPVVSRSTTTKVTSRSGSSSSSNAAWT